MQRDESEKRPEGACIFCRKVGGDDDTEHTIARSDYVYVTLNLYPYNNGHMLVVPYEHTSTPETLSPDALLDLMTSANRAMAVLHEAYHPQAFNIGANIGAEAGAGIEEHFHLHVVPRWGGDTNYMTVVSQTRIIPEWIDDTYRQLREIWERLFSD